MNISKLAFLALLFTILLANSSSALPPFRNPNILEITSFNIRYGTADDGDNHWSLRNILLLTTIKNSRPDLLGTQETLGFQRDYLAKELPGYDVLGVGRDDGAERGEMSALFFRRERFQKLDGGHFWLSETPEKAGSKSWDSSLPRMVTWVKLADQNLKDRPAIYFFNTHFDHRGVKAREESAKLIVRKIHELAKDGPVILTGDFNCEEGSAPYRVLFDKQADGSTLLVDPYRAKHPTRGKDEGTFHAFRGGTDGARIDWIGVSKHFEVENAEIDRTMRRGRYPSDHFPVKATVKWKSN